MAKFSILLISFLAIFANFSLMIHTSNPTNGLTLKLMSAGLPDSPIYTKNQNITRIEIFRRSIAASFSHLEIHVSNMKIMSSQVGKGMRMTPYLSNELLIPAGRTLARYTVQMSIGSQKLPQTLMVDTAGTSCWVQSDPCNRCFEQKPPMYNPQCSTTSRFMTCDHQFCKGYPYQCGGVRCHYHHEYGVGLGAVSVVEGEVAFDTFIATTDPPNQLGEIMFGCTHNTNASMDANGQISGILGMNKGEESFLYQVARRFGGRFSYCIGPYIQGVAPHYFLRFGQDIPSPPPDVQGTSLISLPNPNFYLQLVDVQIGEQKMNFRKGTFGIRQPGFIGGFFVDSGCPMSFFDNSSPYFPYKYITDVFNTKYTFMGLERIQVEGFEYCYLNQNSEGTPFTGFLSMTYIFDGAKYEVPAEFMHVMGDMDQYFCLALLQAPTGFNILGAFQQQNMRLIYDVGNHVFSFYPQNCAKESAFPG